MSIFNLLIYVCILIIIPVLAQDSVDMEIEENRSKLNVIRIKIDSLKVNIDKTERKKKSTLEQLDIIQNEIAYLSEARGLLRKEIKYGIYAIV